MSLLYLIVYNSTGTNIKMQLQICKGLLFHEDIDRMLCDLQINT